MKGHPFRSATRESFLTDPVPVADLRNKPLETPAGPGGNDLLETQLLFNETLIYLGEEKGWYHVEAREQKKLAGANIWAGYPGWVKMDEVAFIVDIPDADVVVSRESTVINCPVSKTTGGLSLTAGTRLRLNAESVGDLIGFYLPDGKTGWICKYDVVGTQAQESPREKRKRVVAAAKSFIGTPYLWGGRSARMPSKTGKTGMDCSGLTNLAFRVSGLDIPRNAHDQWAGSRRVAHDKLKPADLIFLSSEDSPDRIVHVMLFLDEERFIEASETGLPVGIRTFREKFGRTWEDILKNDSTAGSRRVLCGSYLGNG